MEPLYERRNRMTERYFSSVNLIHSLQLRELGDKRKYMKLPNIYRDYYGKEFHGVNHLEITHLVVAGDILFVVHAALYLIPFTIRGEISPLTHADSRRPLHRRPFVMKKKIQYICYNDHADSLIIVFKPLWVTDYVSIISSNITSMKAGGTVERNLFPEDVPYITGWNFDIPNCIGIICNVNERVFKVIELKKYTQLYQIPDGGDNYSSCFLGCGSPGNMEMLMWIYNQNWATKEILLRIYSKQSGQIRKQIAIPVYPHYHIQCVELCGTDRVLLQQQHLGMQVLDISSDVSEIIKTTSIHMADHPYYLHKRNAFICCTLNKRVHVCNLQGDILVTFQDHPMIGTSFLSGSYITIREDIVISLCSDTERDNTWAINISSILTGKCVGKITGKCRSRIRKSALRHIVSHTAFAYDEANHEIFTGNEFGFLCAWSNKYYSDVRHNFQYNWSLYIDYSSGTDDENDSPLQLG